MICEAKSMGEFLNRVDFIQNITKYDKDMLENMVKYVKVLKSRRLN